MNNLCSVERVLSWKKINEASYIEKMQSMQSFQAELDEFQRENHEESAHSFHSWGGALSSSSNSNAKLAWKNGTEKLSQTLNNVRTTFGALSQKIKKSTKKRKPLINTDSPTSPITPYTRSKVALGRTPTKLYSPFSIDTPVGKENFLSRTTQNKSHSDNENIEQWKKKSRRTRLDMSTHNGNDKTGETILANDVLETQIGIYEFQSVANRIVKNGSTN